MYPLHYAVHGGGELKLNWSVGAMRRWPPKAPVALGELEREGVGELPAPVVAETAAFDGRLAPTLVCPRTPNPPEKLGMSWLAS